MSEPHSILLYYTYSAELTGGPGHVLNFVRHLDPNAFRPIFVSHRESPLTDALKSLAVKTIIAPYSPLLDVYRQGILSYSFGKKLRTASALIEYNRQIEAIGREYQVQAIWARNLRSVLSTGFAARRLRIPLIWDSGLERPPRGLMRLTNCLGLGLATRIVSEAACQPREIFGAMLCRAFAHKLTTIHYGIPETRTALLNQPRNYQRSPTAPFRLLNVATIHPRKNQLMLLRAVRQLINAYPQLHVSFVGNVLDQDYFASLQSYVQAHEMSPNVCFLGWRDDVPALMRDADLFVLCSENEGVPHVLQEAMYSGLPAISTAVGGVPEIIQDQETGFLLQRDDTDRLRQVIRQCVEQPQLRRTIGTRAREFVANRFTVENWMADYHQLLQQLCGCGAAVKAPKANPSRTKRPPSRDRPIAEDPHKDRAAAKAA